MKCTLSAGLLVSLFAATTATAQFDSHSRITKSGAPVKNSASSGGTAEVMNLVDANGKKIGVVFPNSLSSSLLAVVEIDGALIGLRLEAYSAGRQRDAQRLQFERPQVERGGQFASSDCSGPPALSLNPLGTRPSQVMAEGPSLNLYIGQVGYSSDVVHYSYMALDGCKVQASGFIANVWPLERVVELTSRFREPFQVILAK